MKKTAFIGLLFVIYTALIGLLFVIVGMFAYGDEQTLIAPSQHHRRPSCVHVCQVEGALIKLSDRGVCLYCVEVRSAVGVRVGLCPVDFERFTQISKPSYYQTIDLINFEEAIN